MISIYRADKIKKVSSVPNGFKPVQVLSWHKKDTKYYELSPYHLRTDANEEIKNPGDVIFENFWQGSKVYDFVYSNEVYPHYKFKGNPKYLWWSYQAENEKEMHYDKELKEITSKWLGWRDSLWSCNHGIRYPNKKNNTKNTQFALNYETGTRYGYIEARKNIYVKEYIRLVRNLEIYKEILNDLKNGVNICIVEMDVPSKGKYNEHLVDEHGIYYPNTDSLKELLEDPREAFGHGLCLALALLEDKL